MCRQLRNDDLTTNKTNSVHLTFTYIITFDLGDNDDTKSSQSESHFVHEKLRLSPGWCGSVD